ncbi:uncharacterized protein LOC104446114 [Eucalyptus grandis]|uniref:uncharacterized protein LOC104446114 n=1 Tax=Eucalyptus grandis TaxID=71139 RepID=UPI00192ED79C|nr:uncharacterized protein LOC104446114 [Eucalyptus grandis]
MKGIKHRGLYKLQGETVTNFTAETSDASIREFMDCSKKTWRFVPMHKFDAGVKITQSRVLIETETARSVCGSVNTDLDGVQLEVELRPKTSESELWYDGCLPVTSFIFLPQGVSHYDELSMKESLIFSDSLKDLKDLRKQLYSAAEYFELSYNEQDHKEIVVNTLRDYATKAFINTADHLGSMTYKVNCLLDDKIGEASAIELRFSCVQQRRRMCEMFVDHGGLSQQSLAIRTPKHHIRYILPGMLPFTRFVIGLLRPKDRSWFMLKNFLSVSKAKDGGDNKNLRYCVTNEVNGEISAEVYPRNIETSASIVRRRHLATQFPQSSRTGPLSFVSTLSNKKAGRY